MKHPKHATDPAGNPGVLAEKQVSILKTPWLLAYRYLGIRIQRTLPYFTDLGLTMQRAALKISLQSYVSLVFFLSGTSFFVSFGITTVLVVFSGSMIWLALLYSFGVGILIGAMVFALLYFLPSLLASSRRKRMELELPYVASHLSILAAAAIPPTRMFMLLEDSRTTPEVASDAERDRPQRGNSGQ